MDVQWGVWKVVPRVEVCVQIGDWSGPLLAGNRGSTRGSLAPELNIVLPRPKPRSNIWSYAKSKPKISQVYVGGQNEEEYNSEHTT